MKNRIKAFSENKVLNAAIKESRKHDAALLQYSTDMDSLVLGRVSEVEGRPVPPEEFMKHGTVRANKEGQLLFWKRQPVLLIMPPDMVEAPGQPIQIKYVRVYHDAATHDLVLVDGEKKEIGRLQGWRKA